MTALPELKNYVKRHVTFEGKDGNYLSGELDNIGNSIGLLNAAIATTTALFPVALTNIATIANNTVLGNVSGSTASPVALTQAQLTALVNTFTTSLSGAVPSPGSATGKFLKDNSTWAAAVIPSNNLTDLTSIPTARTTLGVTATGADTTYCYRSNNLSDVTAATARTNLGLGSAALLTGGVAANNALQLNGSAQYPANDGQLITNVQTYNVGSAPKVLTVIGCFYGGAAVGYGGGVAGTSLGTTSYSIGFSGPYGSTPFLIQNFSSFASLPGSWMNITVQTVNTNGFGIWVRYA
jgi:hypothetical protein